MKDSLENPVLREEDKMILSPSCFLTAFDNKCQCFKAVMASGAFWTTG